MNEIVNKEDLLNACNYALKNTYKDDEHAQNIVLEIFSELLNCSQDALINELLRTWYEKYKKSKSLPGNE